MSQKEDEHEKYLQSFLSDCFRNLKSVIKCDIILNDSDEDTTTFEVQISNTTNKKILSECIQVMHEDVFLILEGEDFNRLNDEHQLLSSLLIQSFCTLKEV